MRISINRRVDSTHIAHENHHLEFPQFTMEDWDNDKFHSLIREAITKKHPGWSITGYSPHTYSLPLTYERDLLSRDDYDRPYTIGFQHPTVGYVTIATIRFGCSEAREVVSSLHTFVTRLVEAYNKEHPA